MSNNFAPVEVPGKYAKSIIGLLTALITAFVTVLTDNTLDTLDLATVGIAGLTAVGVYIIPNLSSGPAFYAKAIVAFAGTGLQALVPFLATGTVTTTQWLMVMVAALGAIGVGIVPNATPKSGNV